MLFSKKLVWYLIAKGWNHVEKLNALDGIIKFFSKIVLFLSKIGIFSSFFLVECLLFYIFPLTEVEGPEFAGRASEVLVSPVDDHGALVDEGGVAAAAPRHRHPLLGAHLAPRVGAHLVHPERRLGGRAEAHLAAEYIQAVLVGDGRVLLQTGRRVAAGT